MCCLFDFGIYVTLTHTWFNDSYSTTKLSACLCTALIGSINHQSTHQPTFRTWEEGAQKEVKWISAGLNVCSFPKILKFTDFQDQLID